MAIEKKITKTPTEVLLYDLSFLQDFAQGGRQRQAGEDEAGMLASLHEFSPSGDMLSDVVEI